jgi:hypothetical protein
VAGEVLTAQQAALSARLHETLVMGVRRAWRSIPDVSDASMVQWLRLILPMVNGAQRQSATIMATYLAALVAELTATAPVHRGVDPALVTGPVIRNGVPPEVVYQRPIITARVLLAKGVGGAEVFRRAERRAVQLATTDVQLARTHAARATLAADPRVVGYRRAVTGNGTCVMCMTASTQRYHRSELLPIHPGCGCSVAPIIGTEDPGRVINERLLAELHNEPNGQPNPKVETYQHGEYGPTLAIAGQYHTRRPIVPPDLSAA